MPVLIALMLLATTVGAATYLAHDGESPPADDVGHAHGESHPPETRGHDHGAHGHDDARSWSALCDGGVRPPAATGARIPTRLDAMLVLDRLPRIVIKSDADFNPSRGVRSGSGAPDDPFVISGVSTDLVHIADTSKWFVIRESHIGRLILDWTGPGGLVHANRIQSLETNRNVARTGDATAAVIVDNEIARVKEIRHFDGVVARNVIGDPLEARPGVVLNIAGFNGAEFTRNTIYGAVDMKLHGHHHSSSMCARGHNHGASDDGGIVDHTVRHIHFRFHHNTIRDPTGAGLRYNDLNHAGDDRKAASEQNEELEKPHVHHTRVSIDNNTIEKSSLRIAIFNAQDERHLHSEGVLVIENNTIQEPAVGSGLVVQAVRDASVVLRGNVATKPLLRLSGESGILLDKLRNTQVLVAANALDGFTYGVRAHDFDANTTWRVAANAMNGVKHPVYWDSTVANPPETEGGHAGHRHETVDAVEVPLDVSIPIVRPAIM